MLIVTSRNQIKNAFVCLIFKHKKKIKTKWR